MGKRLSENFGICEVHNNPRKPERAVVSENRFRLPSVEYFSVLQYKCRHCQGMIFSLLQVSGCGTADINTNNNIHIHIMMGPVRIIECVLR